MKVQQSEPREARRPDPSKVTVAIPLYNEEESASELLTRVRAVLSALPAGPHELVIVDDGSHDRTPEIVERFDYGAGIETVLVRFSRNFGHQAALTAALEYASGDVVILMDGDLQDPPETIPTLIESYRDGFDVVYVRRSTRVAPWYLRLAYFLFYRTIGMLSDLKMPLDSGDFALLSRKVVDAMNSAPEHNRYLRGLRAWAGFSQTGVEVDRPARGAGASKYSARRLIRLALDGIISFSEIPLRLASIIGGLTVLFCFIYAAYSVFAKFFLDSSPRGFTALIVVIVFVSGVQLFFLGVIGEYVGRIYSEVKGRPNYVVREVSRMTTAGHSEAHGS